MTLQISDTVVWRGEEQTHVSGNLIQGAWPEGQEPKFHGTCSANWKGYRATWLVDDVGWLRLASITGELECDVVKNESIERIHEKTAAIVEKKALKPQDDIDYEQSTPDAQQLILDNLKLYREAKESWNENIKPGELAFKDLKAKIQKSWLDTYKALKPPMDIPSELVERLSNSLFGSPMEQLYRLCPGHDGPVVATWFNGELITGYGDIVKWGYSPVYQHYVVFQVEQGKVVKIEEHDSNWWSQRENSWSIPIP